MKRVLAVVAVASFGVNLASFAAPCWGQKILVQQAARVWIAGGWFHRGSNSANLDRTVRLCRKERRLLGEQGCRPEAFTDETPAHRSWLPGFDLDRFEVTYAQWNACVRAGQCPPLRVSGNDRRVARSVHPATGMTWREARAYCAFAGGRLPTEAEWEKAARGHSVQLFPWGEFHNPTLANQGKVGFVPDTADGYRHAAPADSFSAGASPYGAINMAGNVWEWTADAYAEGGYAEADPFNPQGANPSGQRIVRGGSWRSPPHTLRVTNRTALPEGEAFPDVGVRCAYDPPPAPTN